MSARQNLKRQTVIEQCREVEQAISALTMEIVKLSSLQGEELECLSVTIKNAISRLAIAIMAKSSNDAKEEVGEAMEAAAAI
jgi:hypothetical protein